MNASIVNAKKMLVHYKRIYEIQSVKDEPIHAVTHQIATDVEKTLDALNIKVYVQNNEMLKISSVEVDKPNQKEFATMFRRPVLKEEKRRYFLEYDVEEPEPDRCFEIYS